MPTLVRQNLLSCTLIATDGIVLIGGQCETTASLLIPIGLALGKALE
jgi:hypothetical protein